MVLHKTVDGMISCSHWDDLATTFLGEGRNRYCCAYLVFTDGTDAYAQNGTTGAIDYGGPDDNGGVDGGSAAAVIQAALNNLTAGRDWKERVILKGDFTLLQQGSYSNTDYDSVLRSHNYCLLVPSYTILEIDGKLTNINADVETISVYNSHDIDIRGGEIEGDTTVRTTHVVFFNSYDVNIENVYIHKNLVTSGSQGILIKGNSTAPVAFSYNVRVSKCTFREIGDYSVYVDHGREVEIVENIFEDVQKGVHAAWGSERVLVDSNNFYTTNSYCLRAETQSHHINFENNILYDAGDDGIILSYHIKHCNVVGNTVDSPTKNGVRIYSADIPTIPADKAFVTDGDCEHNNIVGNLIEGVAGAYNAFCLTARNTRKALHNSFVGNLVDDVGGSLYKEEEFDTGEVNNNYVFGNKLYDNVPAVTITGDETAFEKNYGYNPIGIVATPFDNVNNDIELNGTVATPIASTDYTVRHTSIKITSTDSGNTDCAIMLKDPAGVNVLQATLSIIEEMYVPRGFQLNWGAFTGAAPTVTVAFV